MVDAHMVNSAVFQFVFAAKIEIFRPHAGSIPNFLSNKPNV